MKARLLLPFFLLAGAAGCGDDPFAVRPQFPTSTAEITTFAFSGSDILEPVAINVASLRAVRLEAASQYDLVLDINAQGQAVIMPPLAVGHIGRTGLIVSDQPWEQITSAPVDGYNDREPRAVAPGTVLLVRTQPAQCAGAIRPNMYAKLRVDSVSVPRRTVHVTMRLNPNCSFRELNTGLPTF